MVIASRKTNDVNYARYHAMKAGDWMVTAIARDRWGNEYASNKRSSNQRLNLVGADHLHQPKLRSPTSLRVLTVFITFSRDPLNVFLFVQAIIRNIRNVNRVPRWSLRRSSEPRNVHLGRLLGRNHRLMVSSRSKVGHPTQRKEITVSPIHSKAHHF